MLRGEFRRADGLVIPNNITRAGTEAILRAALRAESFSIFAALADCVPDPDLLIADAGEPVIGTNGYARIELERNTTDWPTVDEVNGEVFVESAPFTFAAVGGSFSRESSRVMLVSASTAGSPLALSGAFTPITIGTATAEELRTFQYRLYLR